MQNHDPSNNRAALAGDLDEIVARTAIDSFTTEVLAAGHTLTADEPTDVGGNDKGPSPYDLLAAALATCTTMTLKMYAARKELSLRSVTVRVTHDKVHAKDCSDCESGTGRIDEFRRVLSFDGELSAAERQRLLEIADMCPVHRTLQGEIKIRTSAAP
ncbi:MAG TPA: OsmC family protein [Woeseiaceae bacterium]|nr:OsmC family protein [Woeseiaceae bacterium]